LFSTKRPQQRYCDDNCRRASISKDKQFLTEIPCAYCEKLFTPQQSTARFCSRECAYNGRKPPSHVFGQFKLTDGSHIRFESSYELVFLLYASQHDDKYRNLRRCNFSIPYNYDGEPHRYYPDFMAEDGCDRECGHSPSRP
jgi:hypothetical protein